MIQQDYLQTFFLFIVPLVGAFVGSFFKSYMKKRGEILAENELSNTIRENHRLVKEIEGTVNQIFSKQETYDRWLREKLEEYAELVMKVQTMIICGPGSGLTNSSNYIELYQDATRILLIQKLYLTELQADSSASALFLQ